MSTAPVLQLRIPIRAATSRRKVQHQPERIQVRPAARILSGVGHRTAHLAGVEVTNDSVAPAEDAEARDVGVFRIDIGTCVSPDRSDTNGRFAKPRCFLYSISRSIGERAVTAMATRSRRLTAVPFQELRNDVHMGHGALRCGPYIML